jgi:hypothetical protein
MSEAADAAHQQQVLYNLGIPHQENHAPGRVDQSDAMKVELVSYPPLGQLTLLDRAGDGLHFTVVLGVHPSRAESPWEVSIWHSREGDAEWTALPQEEEGSRAPVALQRKGDEQVCSLAFRGTLATDCDSVRFTCKFRYRLNDDEPWRWIKEEQSVADGQVILRRTAAASGKPELSDIIPDLGSAFRVTEELSQTPDTQLWSIEFDVDGSEGGPSCYQNIKIGTPWGGFAK